MVNAGWAVGQRNSGLTSGSSCFKLGWRLFIGSTIKPLFSSKPDRYRPVRRRRSSSLGQRRNRVKRADLTVVGYFHVAASHLKFKSEFDKHWFFCIP